MCSCRAPRDGCGVEVPRGMPFPSRPTNHERGWVHVWWGRRSHLSHAHLCPDGYAAGDPVGFALLEPTREASGQLGLFREHVIVQPGPQKRRVPQLEPRASHPDLLLHVGRNDEGLIHDPLLQLLV